MVVKGDVVKKAVKKVVEKKIIKDVEVKVEVKKEPEVKKVLEVKMVVTPEMIAQKAYELYEKRGRLNGYELADWLEAKRILETGK